MKKCISICLFGYNKQYENCFSFNTYLTYLSINLRAYYFVYPEWEIVLHIDCITYNFYKKYFDDILKIINISYKVYEPNQICKSMIWRLNTISEYDYTICRDIDSLPTFRERLCVEQWISENTNAHSINDSISHTIPLMGGMVGFKKNTFPIEILNNNYDFSQKGSDQVFMNEYITPYLSSYYTQHRFLGFPVDSNNPFSRNYINTSEIYLDEYKLRADLLCNHIGQSGFHLEKTYNNLTDKHYEGAIPFYTQVIQDKIPFNKELLEIEKHYEFFYWAK
jgi:hypothetical protein